MVGFVANLMIRPVDEKHYDDDAVRAEAEEWADEDRVAMSRGGK